MNPNVFHPLKLIVVFKKSKPKYIISLEFSFQSFILTCGVSWKFINNARDTTTNCDFTSKNNDSWRHFIKVVNLDELQFYMFYANLVDDCMESTIVRFGISFSVYSLTFLSSLFFIVTSLNIRLNVCPIDQVAIVNHSF